MIFKRPTANQVFAITAAPAWPNIVFETDASGPHTWTWTLVWGVFTRTGKVTTTGNTWDAQSAITNLGGTLTVRAEANKVVATLVVLIRGTNPTEREVTNYLATKPNAAGFDKILAQESRFQHFTAKREPIKSFDNGFGMCQLTTPMPSFEQVWNWKSNVDGGLALFAQKRAGAIGYLGQSNRSFTADQVKFETVCRWNGGSYHEWDATAAKWVRKSTLLCDAKTGNIGWDLSDPQNAGKTEAELDKRDSASYSKPPGAGAHWKYLGVCYADHVLR